MNPGTGAPAARRDDVPEWPDERRDRSLGAALDRVNRVLTGLG